MCRIKSWIRKKIWAFLGNSLDKKLEKYTTHTLKIRDKAEIEKIAEQLYKMQIGKGNV